MIDITGSWSLISSINYRNEDGTPTFGNPPSGQIQYTSDGRMSAYLQDPEWVKRGDIKADPFTEFFAYAGRWTLDGDQIRHDIEFCSVPTKVGTFFTRTVNVIDENKIKLVTAPETSKSGAVYITELTWVRNT